MNKEIKKHHMYFVNVMEYISKSKNRKSPMRRINKRKTFPKQLTLLSGRYIEIKMLPLSFKEYYSAFKDKNESKDRLFLEYMKNGGMPGNISILETNPNDIDKYLDGIFSTVVYKDIMARNNIGDKILSSCIIC